MTFCDYIYDLHQKTYSDWVLEDMEYNISSVYSDKEIESDYDYFTTYLEYIATVHNYDVDEFVSWSLNVFAESYDSDLSDYIQNDLGYKIVPSGYFVLYYEPIDDDSTDAILSFTYDFVNNNIVDTYESTVLFPSVSDTPVPVESAPVASAPVVSSLPVSGQAVTINDIYVELTTVNSMLLALLGVILFIWLEKKIKHIVKKFQGGEN